MGYWEKYSDLDNKQLADLPYKNYSTGSHGVAGHKLYVKSVIKQPDGVEAYVVVPKSEAHLSPSHVHHVAVIYRGSDNPLSTKGNGPADWTNDLVGAEHQVLGIKGQPEGFQDAGRILNKEMARYKNAKFVVTGHSYGGSSAYAAGCDAKDIGRIEAIRCYESPNMANTLTSEQLKNAKRLSKRTYTYIDTKDMVGIGYALYSHTGHLMEIISPGKYKGLKGEHMWGGYYFRHGKLLHCKEVKRLPLITGAGVAGAGALDLCLALVSYGELSKISGNPGVPDNVGGDLAAIERAAALIGAAMTAAESTASVLVEGVDASLPTEYRTAKRSAEAVAPDLSEGEIVDAFHDVGYTYHKYVTEPCRKLDRRADALKTAASQTFEYTRDLNMAANEIGDTDNANAARMGTLTSPSQLFNVR